MEKKKKEPPQTCYCLHKTLSRSNLALNQDETQANSWDVILQLSCVAAVPERSPSRYAKDRRSAGPLTTLIVGAWKYCSATSTDHDIWCDCTLRAHRLAALKRRASQQVARVVTGGVGVSSHPPAWTRRFLCQTATSNPVIDSVCVLYFISGGVKLYERCDLGSSSHSLTYLLSEQLGFRV